MAVRTPRKFVRASLLVIYLPTKDEAVNQTTGWREFEPCKGDSFQNAMQSLRQDQSNVLQTHTASQPKDQILHFYGMVMVKGVGHREAAAAVDAQQRRVMTKRDDSRVVTADAGPPLQRMDNGPRAVVTSASTVGG